jgi:hypothetical protein
MPEWLTQLPRRAEDRAWVIPALLGVALLGVALLVAHYTFTIWAHTYDEDVYYVTGRMTWDGLPQSLWQSTADGRGLQRLQSWLMGFGLGIFGTPTGYRVVRWVDIAAYVGTAIPVWYWIRACGVSRPVAAAGAVLAVLTPWVVVTSTFMTESLAYPLATWALYRVWKVAVRPSLGGLVYAGAVIFLAMLARSVMLLLLPTLVVAMVAVGLRFGGVRGAWEHRRTARAVAPWVIVGSGTLLVLALVVADRSALSPLTGIYSTSLGVNLDALPRLIRWDLAYVVSGIAILPGVVALAWIGRSLVKPARAESLALAVIAVAIMVVVAYSTMRAGADERYIMYLAPSLVVCAAVGLGRREVGPVWLLAGGAFTIWLFSGVPWREAAAAYDYYVYAAQVFHGRILLANVGSHVPDVGLSNAALLALGIAVATALAAAALWRGGALAKVVVAACLVGVLGVQLAQASYIPRHFAAEANYGPPDLAPHSWVDKAVGRDATVGIFVTRTGPDVNYLYDVWREVAFFNIFHRVIFQIAGSVALKPLYGEQKLIAIDPKTGRLSSDAPIPQLMMELQINPKSPLYGKTLAYGNYVPFSVVRTYGPPRVKWLVTGSDDASYTMPDQPTRLRVYKGAGNGDCVSLVFQPPDGLTAPRPVTVRSGGHVYRTVVPPGPGKQGEVTNVRLAGGDALAYADVTMQARGTTTVFGAPRGVRLAGIQRQACT